MRRWEDGGLKVQVGLWLELYAEQEQRKLEGLPEPELIYLPKDQWEWLLCLEDHPEQSWCTELSLWGVKMKKEQQ